MPYNLHSKTITVTTPGTAVAGPNVIAKKVKFIGAASNVGEVWFRHVSDATTDGRTLQAKESDEYIAPDNGDLNLSMLRVDATNAGDKLVIVYQEFTIV